MYRSVGRTLFGTQVETMERAINPVAPDGVQFQEHESVCRLESPTSGTGELLLRCQRPSCPLERLLLSIAEHAVVRIGDEKLGWEAGGRLTSWG